MPTPLEFLAQYRGIQVPYAVEDPVRKQSRVQMATVQIKNYFMMDWDAGAEERHDYDAVTQGAKNDAWFQSNKERIRTAAMGKGAPADYQLALEWAVRSGKVKQANPGSIQAYSDEHLGIDCSGFVTNYLAANGSKAYSADLVRNTSAASYFKATQAVNDPLQVRRGDLLVWMDGNVVKSSPGHVAVVESFLPQSTAAGNMRVVEATGASGANPKLLDSMYHVEKIIPKSASTPAMILVVKRHGISGSRVAVIRP